MSSLSIKSHLGLEVTTLATCWLLTLKSGKQMGFTDFDQDLNIDNVTYNSNLGFNPSAILNNSSLAVDNLEIQGVLDNTLITEEDILIGLYDHAEVEVFLINHQDTSAGKLHLKRGWFGEVVLKNGLFLVEVKGLTDAFNKNIGCLYSPKCRAKFGDEKCQIDVKKLTFTGSAKGNEGKTIILDYDRKEPQGFFKYGSLKFLTGRLKGISIEIQESNLDKITLSTPLPFEPQIGDEYQITAGCDKHFTTCVNVYNNAINFRGEPHVPGIAKLIRS